MSVTVSEEKKNPQTRTFYVASYSPGDEPVKKKCCLSLPDYLWYIFDENKDQYNKDNGLTEEKGNVVSASKYLRLIIKKYLIKNLPAGTAINNEWGCLQDYCRARNKTYVSAMHEIVLNSYNSVSTIFDIGVERLHYEIFGKPYSDVFNEKIEASVGLLKEKDKTLFESIYLTRSVKNSMIDGAILKEIRASI